ncbi:hypothetical protein PRIPAC_90216 [Pristionchus pacificus]|uniref:Uncharacterized protein n=1 Tax=Pristionchus pacificus TaxID=54126 RepID=A0A2A6CWK7_PRIPA|nr:hypothetical protein PRIPAC_90216 [Pristionchus pacificus]|eukprot:PDM82575.1 hypothetical protein PRIPAC_36968 [Pristionchus pacificus]
MMKRRREGIHDPETPSYEASPHRPRHALEARMIRLLSRLLLASIMLPIAQSDGNCEWYGTWPTCLPDECPSGTVEVGRMRDGRSPVKGFGYGCWAPFKKRLCCKKEAVKADISKHCHQLIDVNRRADDPCPIGQSEIFADLGHHVAHPLCCDWGTIVI